MTGDAMPRGLWRPAAVLLLVVLAGTWSCGDGMGPGDPPDEVGPAIVSDPVTSVSPATAMGTSALLAPGVAYVSFPPGTYPSGATATITNRRTADGLTTSLVAGGLDPVAIIAEVGDTLAFAIDTGAAHLARFVQPVPEFIKVRVVRTEPPTGKRDVPLNLRVRVVFSEPVDPASVTPATLGLQQAGTSVTGEVAVSADGLEATFDPSADLLPETDYTIEVGGGIRDSDGSQLVAPVTAQFTTGTATGAAVALRFVGQPASAITGMPMRSPVVVEATDASGSPATGFTGKITIAIRSNSGGGSLSGTTTRAGPSAEFDDVHVDQVGEGYMLSATSPGLGEATSSTFNVVPATDLIAFASSGEGVVVTRADGSGSSRLGPWDEAADPTWSPDGAKLAFTWPGAQFPCAQCTIYVMNADGSGVTSPGDGISPAWSPDGTKIATGTLDSWISVMNANGSGVVGLRDEATGQTYDIEPAWSPDGKRLAFARAEFPDLDNDYRTIYVMNADGSEVVALTSPTGWDSDPAWSPDGTKIAFSRARGSHRFDVYVMNAEDGSEVTNLTGSHPRLASQSPTWSPDGRRIAYSSSPDPDVEPYSIYVMDADGSGATRVNPPAGATDLRASLDPAWSPQ